MQMTGHKTRSGSERYSIVSSGELRAAARSLDAFNARSAGEAKRSAQGQFQGQSNELRGSQPV